MRIGGISGITKGYDLDKGHFEKAPFDEQTMRSVFHTRRVDSWLLSMAGRCDVMMSHDWPTLASQGGDTKGLMAKKPHFREDMEAGRLGSTVLSQLLNTTKPGVWLSAHLHVKHVAVVGDPNHPTRFLALDKPTPGRQFMQFLRFPRSGPLTLTMCPVWASVLAHWLPQLPYRSGDRINLPPQAAIVPTFVQSIEFPEFCQDPAKSTEQLMSKILSSKVSNEVIDVVRKKQKQDPNEIDLDDEDDD